MLLQNVYVICSELCVLLWRCFSSQYGGDVTRKMKLLRKQKEGKKKLKRIGNIELSREAFLSILER